MDYTYIPDLTDRLEQLVEEHDASTDHVKGHALYVDDRIKVLALPFRAGQALDEHQTSHPAILHFLKGEADITLGSDEVNASAGTWIHMPPNLPHSIRARTSTVMLLQVFRG